MGDFLADQRIQHRDHPVSVCSQIMPEKFYVVLTTIFFDQSATDRIVTIAEAIELDRRLHTGKPKPLPGIMSLSYTMPKELPDDDQEKA